MNDETFTPCTKCGRPMAYCKGQCCGKSKGCCCQEYGPMKPGCIREVKPGCPYKAVIPTLTVEDKSNLKDLADCFVHVSNINTTFYIDDKHRTIVTWAGPVEYDNYDLDANTLGLRSQFLIDKTGEYVAYYDKTGEYQKFAYGERETPLRVRVVSYDTEAMWHYSTLGYGYNINYAYDPEAERQLGSIIMSMKVPSPVLQDMDASETISLKEVYDAVASGREVKMYNLPFSWECSAADDFLPVDILPDFVGRVDGVSFSGISVDSLTAESHAVGSAPSCFHQGFGVPNTVPLCFAITEVMNEGTGENEYNLVVQGLYTAVNPS